jgi:hypothetical protein
MPDLFRPGFPIVVLSILVTHGRFCQLTGVRVVEASEVYRVIDARQGLAAEGNVQMCPAERLYAAASAEQVVDGIAAELVVRKIFLAPEEPERIRLDECFPIPRL